MPDYPGYRISAFEEIARVFVAAEAAMANLDGRALEILRLAISNVTPEVRQEARALGRLSETRKT